MGRNTKSWREKSVAYAAAIVVCLWAWAAEASDSSAASSKAAESKRVSHRAMFEKMCDQYGNSPAYEAEVRKCVVDSEGERDPAIPMEKVTFRYSRPQGLKIEAPNSTIVANGEHALMVLAEQQIYMKFDAPEKLGTDELVAINPYLADARLYPIIDVLNRNISAYNGEMNDTNCRGKSTLCFMVGESTSVQLFINPITGHLVRSRVALDADGKYWAQADYLQQKLNADFSPAEFNTAPPPHFMDMTEPARRNSPSYYHQFAMKNAGKPAPAFELMSLDAQTVHLEDAAGKVVVLDFWATWCPPCVNSAPHIEAAKQALEGEKVQFWGMNMDSGARRERAVRNFMREYEMTIDQLLVNGNDLPAQYRVERIPTLVFIDQKGIYRDVHLGEIKSPDIIINKVNKLLKE